MIIRFRANALLHFLLLRLSSVTTAQNVASKESAEYTISSFDRAAALTLSPACLTIYNKSIPSCQPYDFNALNPCTASCIQSLRSLETEAQAACRDEQMPDTSMLAYFRNGTGVDELCTSMKRVSPGTTMAASPLPTPGNSGAAAAATSSQKGPFAPGGTSTATAVPAKTEGMGMGLDKSMVLAIVISVVVAVVFFIIVFIFLYRKYYHRK